MTELSQLNVPGPTITPLTEPFWQEAGEGKLIIQCCGKCDHAVFYPRGRCPHCWSAALGWVSASGKGALKSFSEIWKPGHPGWLPATPYVVGLVELAEGPTMLSHVLTGGAPVAVGDKLRFIARDIGGRILPCFEITNHEGRDQ